MRLLICEDELQLSQALEEILRHNNYSVDTVNNGEDALDYLATENYDGVILDIMMPKLDGISVLKELRRQGNSVPVLLLTAKSQTEDKVQGLDSGADDYLTKPFEIKELLARIRSMTRRAKELTDNVLSFGDLLLNRANFTLSSHKGDTVLGNKEFQIFEMLMVHPGSVISADTFMDRVWGFDSEAEMSIVWVYISNLRKKLASLGSIVEIRAVRNVGYKLETKNGKNA